MYPVPTSLSPSRMEAFTSCPLAFRFTSIEGLPDPPMAHSTKGSLVHRALELLFVNPPDRRALTEARTAYERAVAEYEQLPDLVDLHLSAAAHDELVTDGWALVESYLRMEDPAAVRAIGLELRMEADIGDLRLRGIIDRLELDDDGGLVVTDYKTGRSPGAGFERRSFGALDVYAMFCEAMLGRRPSAIRLLFLRTGLTITIHPSAQSVGFVATRARAIHAAIEQACTIGRFEPRPGGLSRVVRLPALVPLVRGRPVPRRRRSGRRAAHSPGSGSVSRFPRWSRRSTLASTAGSSTSAATPSPTSSSRSPASSATSA
ncbi:MAG: PD-(D/E)XK nuclease family protein [Ilumatobacteraceae bacterium]